MTKKSNMLTCVQIQIHFFLNISLTLCVCVCDKFIIILQVLSRSASSTIDTIMPGTFHIKWTFLLFHFVRILYSSASHDIIEVIKMPEMIHFVFDLIWVLCSGAPVQFVPFIFHNIQWMVLKFHGWIFESKFPSQMKSVNQARIIVENGEFDTNILIWYIQFFEECRHFSY